MTAAAGDASLERQMRQRHITLSAEAPATPHIVHVAVGTATVLLFDSPVLPASLELGASRERFERIDITERALILQPRLELASQERIPLTLRFADGHFPSRVTLALMARPGEVDLQVRVFRTALAPEALVEHLGAMQARCEDSGRFANLLFTRNLGDGIVARELSYRVTGKAGPLMVHRVGPRAFLGADLLALEIPLFLVEGHLSWRPGRVEVFVEATGEEVPIRSMDLDVQVLQPGAMGRLVVEFRARPSFPSERLRIHLHEQRGPRGLQLRDVHILRSPAEERH
ncbi:DUF2381 family protein [Pyxidicoccus fallax]|uniref:DUF2381 family protein n=2 Tax=Pyxidicoccus fallax TaxID=394095 RepID=A0A848LD78_9BACT|nr:DUF2381 family protein [Pyxidicoccus fallax]NPC78178.1 DUF2381 family protein [Pyxidicoccus fallax]